MRPYEILETEEILEYINLVTDNYHIVERFTITPPSVEFDDYDAYFTFQVGTKQETADEYIFNEGDEFIFGVELGSRLGFLDDLGVYITFYYYELDKADIDETKSYDDLKTMNFQLNANTDEYTITFNKPTYLLKEFQVQVKKSE